MKPLYPDDLLVEHQIQGRTYRAFKLQEGPGVQSFAPVGFQYLLEKRLLWVERNGSLREAELGPAKDFLPVGDGFAIQLEGIDGKNKFDQAFMLIPGAGNSWVKAVAKFTCHNPVSRQPGNDSMAYVAVSDFPQTDEGRILANGNLPRPSGTPLQIKHLDQTILTDAAKQNPEAPVKSGVAGESLTLHALQPQGARVAVHASKGTAVVRVAFFIEPRGFRALHFGLRDQKQPKGTTWNKYELQWMFVNEPPVDDILEDELVMT